MRINPGFLLALLFILSNSLTAFAQETTPAPAKPHLYFNSFQAGALLGEKDKGTSFTFSTVHGINRNGIIAGLGFGYDSFQRWKTIPVTFVVGGDLAKIKNNPLYLSFALGYAWGQYRSQSEYDAKIDGAKGVAINPMLGYKIRADKYNLYISAGYRFQRLDYTKKPFFWGNTETVEEDIQRMVVQIGFGLD